MGCIISIVKMLMNCARYVLYAADHLDNIELQENNAYEVAIKRTPLDVMQHMEPCCAYGVVK